MSITRSQLGRGPAIVQVNGVTLFTRDDIVSRKSPVWNPVPTSMYGQVDRFQKDRVYRVPLRLWGAWENLATLFPGYALNPVAGASIFGNADNPLVILARNGDQITYFNSQLTKLSALYLGVDAELFAADVEFTAILRNATNPETANAYYQVQTAQAYNDNAFAKTNYKRVRFTAGWGAIAGYAAFISQKGWQISWDLDAKPLTCDGLGTVDFTVGPDVLIGTARGIPVGPTLAQIEAQAPDQGVPLGSLLSANIADLTLTGAGIAIVLKNAGISEHGYAFGIEPLRVGEHAWITTRGFAAGAPAAVGTVA